MKSGSLAANVLIAVLSTALGVAPAAAQTGASQTAEAAAPVPTVAAPLPPAPVAAAAGPAAIPLPVSMGVAAYYQSRPATRIWFRPGASASGEQLVAILKRGELDGLDNAPRLASDVEAALARGRSGDPAVQLAAERLLSAAWVLYVQAVRKPVPGVEYGDRSMAPRPATPEWVLLQAEHAPSLDVHLRAVSSVNPLYASLRDAAWSQIQASGQPVDPRLRPNLERARLLPSAGRYILVDAASARLWMYEDGRETDSMKVIVGKRDAQTPMIASTISYATFNPYWNIPTDVAKRVVAPLVVKRGTKYLKAARYEVASGWTDDAAVVPSDEVDWKGVADGSKQVRIRQLPGADNMMGDIKFNFPNSTGIYLHDTPQKTLFAKDKRTFSLGCVRLEDAPRLARWLLGRDPVAPSDAPEQHVQLPSGVPIYITYLTAHAEAGQLTFADDVYGLDRSPALEVAAAR